MTAHANAALLRSTAVSFAQRFSLLQALVTPCLLYGSDVWMLTLGLLGEILMLPKNSPRRSIAGRRRQPWQQLRRMDPVEIGKSCRDSDGNEHGAMAPDRLEVTLAVCWACGTATGWNTQPHGGDLPCQSHREGQAASPLGTASQFRIH